MKVPRVSLLSLSLLVLLLCVPPTTANTANECRLGPVGFFAKHGGGFTWRASVNRATGQAAAHEVSRLPATWSQALLSGGKRGGILAQTTPLLGHYPQWLCRGAVTLGLLHAVPAASGGTTTVQTRVLGIRLLTFGKPVGQRMAVQSANLRQEALIWKYPIVGGLLAAQPGGHLILTLQCDTVGDATAVLESHIVEYRPRLIGTRTPANPVRVGLYLGTQSVVHAYVMWRFHGHVRHFFDPTQQQSVVGEKD